MAHRAAAVLLAAGLPFLSVHAQMRAPERHLELVREVAIGQADGPPEYAFGRVGPLAANPSGAIYVLDNDDQQIRRYDANGRFLGLVGRSGAGPGEYRLPLAMALHGDSLLVVFDPGNGRISVFDTAGKYRRAIAFARGAFFGEQAFDVDRAGRLYVRAGRGERLEGPGSRTQFVRLRIEGTILDSVALPPEDMRPGEAFVLITADGARWNFPNRTVFGLLADGGLMTAKTTEYRITVTPVQGTPFTIERLDPRIPVEAAERSEWEAFAQYFARRDRRTPATIPSVKPSIRALSSDPSGRIWVNVYTKAVKRDIPPRPAGDLRPVLTIREPNVYDVFAGDGRYLGRVELPPHSVLMAVTGDRIWVRTEAEGGEYVLTRSRVAGLGSR